MTEIGTFIIACYTALLLAVVALCYFFMRRWRWKWAVIAPMLLGVAWLSYSPYAEERDIQTRFAELCKDAGVKILRKVEVEGFYDDTMPNTVGPGPFSPQAVASFEGKGYQFYEYRFIGPTGAKQNTISLGRVAHYEKKDGVWKSTLLREPRAQYHFKQLRSAENVGHKIWVTEYAIIDSQHGETIAREIRYMSLPNKIDLWWASMLGNPTQFCPENRSTRLLDDVFTPLGKRH